MPPGFDLRRFAARSFGAFQESTEAIVLRFAPEAAADVARFSFHPDQTVEDEPSGATVVRFTAGGLREIVHHLFTWGMAVEVVAPERLRLMLITDLKAALEQAHGHRRSGQSGNLTRPYLSFRCLMGRRRRGARPHGSLRDPPLGAVRDLGP